MAPIYSQTFLEAHDLSGSTGPLSPPTGNVWVVRGIDVVNGELLNNILVKGAGGQVVWANSFGGTLAFDYARYRGRWVIEAGSFFVVETTAALDVTVWGYNLTAP